MDGARLTEDFETGLYHDRKGRVYVRCAFNEDAVEFMDVTGERWSLSYAGSEHSLNWSEFNWHKSLKKPLREVVARRMKDRSPSYLSKLRSVLSNLAEAAATVGVDLSPNLSRVSPSNWLRIWSEMTNDARSHFRSIYAHLAEHGLAGASYGIASEMKSWRARNDVLALRDVLEWDAENGALLTVESELLRELLERDSSNESDADCAVRIFGWICFNIIKRPQQILSMRRDALRTIDQHGIGQHFLRIPKVKAQVGRKPALWQISAPLAAAIKAYSMRPAIRELQTRFDRLIVIPAKQAEERRWMIHGQVDVQAASSGLRAWVNRAGLISPRTGRLLNVTPLRLRHTGATAMAKQGKSRQEIQDTLEHDSPFSAQAYIDSLAADLLPVYERGKQRLGAVFSPLADAYFFQGEIVDQVERKPISVPVVVEGVRPAVVGSCGKKGSCNKHPFWACYDGCPRFLAWRAGSHRKALAHAEAEFKRWNAAEQGGERSKALKDFDRVGAAIREVIARIEQGS